MISSRLQPSSAKAIIASSRVRPGNTATMQAVTTLLCLVLLPAPSICCVGLLDTMAQDSRPSFSLELCPSPLMFSLMPCALLRSANTTTNTQHNRLCVRPILLHCTTETPATTIVDGVPHRSQVCCDAVIVQLLLAAGCWLLVKSRRTIFQKGLTSNATS